jgi:hypothetical protein
MDVHCKNYELQKYPSAKLLQNEMLDLNCGKPYLMTYFKLDIKGFRFLMLEDSRGHFKIKTS